MRNILNINLIHPSIYFPMKKLLFVFILSLLLTFTGCKSVVKDIVVEPVVVVEKKQIWVMFERKVNGKWGWYEDGDEAKETNMWVKFKMVNLMVEEILLSLMETSMKENSRMVN